MKNIKCPYCGIALSESMNKVETNFSHLGYPNRNEKSDYCIVHYLCPDCDNITVMFIGNDNNAKDIYKLLVPKSNARCFPDYIPQQIRNDYTEAYNIQQLSPKASATLSRRCLQGMIRDFFNVHEKSLHKEIDAIKDKIDPAIWQAINSVRHLGNIGAHMEQDIDKIIDIDPDEASKLIKLIEFLLEKWYINRHDLEMLLDDINAINDKKQTERKS